MFDKVTKDLLLSVILLAIFHLLIYLLRLSPLMVSEKASAIPGLKRGKHPEAERKPSFLAFKKKKKNISQ